MPGRIECDWAMVIPKGDTFAFNIKNRGGRQIADGDKAELVVKSRDGATEYLRKTVQGEEQYFRFKIEPEDTASMDEGIYLYDVVITCEDGSIYSVFAPSMRKFVVGRSANGQETW